MIHFSKEDKVFFKGQCLDFLKRHCIPPLPYGWEDEAVLVDYDLNKFDAVVTPEEIKHVQKLYKRLDS